MSDLSEIEKEQEAPTMREPATGPLLPLWFRALLYAIFVPFCIFSIIYISRSIHIQRRLTAAARLVKGGLAEMTDLSSAEGRQAIEFLRKHPRDGFLYLNQELMREEVKDPRMARALALRKTLDWRKNSTRQEVIRQMIAHMTDEGGVESGFVIDQQTQKILEEMVSERLADPEATYAEDRITEVLAWLADGHPGQPKGPEERRMGALERQYAKKAFVGQEAKALKILMLEWQQDSNPVAREAASRFAEMLERRKTEMPAETTALCEEHAVSWEERYRRGMIRIAQVAYQTLEEIIEKDLFLDHPHIYQYLNLLGHKFEEVREQVVEGAWLLRHNQFTIRFLSFYATKTAINPVMAVETVRLTKEEHEREMRRQNTRRMREAVQVLGRIGKDYVEHRDQYNLKVSDPDEFIRNFVVHALQDVADVEVISDPVAEALDGMRRADLARSGGPLFFRSARER